MIWLEDAVSSHNTSVSCDYKTLESTMGIAKYNYIKSCWRSSSFASIGSTFVLSTAFSFRSFHLPCDDTDRNDLAEYAFQDPVDSIQSP